MHAVAAVSNGQEALSVLAEHSVDIILLDMEMPVMNGIEFLKAMKRTPYSPPIIVVSAHAAPCPHYHRKSASWCIRLHFQTEYPERRRDHRLVLDPNPQNQSDL